MSAQHLAEKVAKINIKLIHGENLPTRGENTEPEYVCRLRISKPHPTPEHDIPRTHPVKGSVSPQFNQEFQLDVKNPPAAQMEILVWDVSPMTENPPGKEVFIGDVLVNICKLIDYAGEPIAWPFEIRKRSTAGIDIGGKIHTQILFDQDCNVDLYLDHQLKEIQDKEMFGLEVHCAFEEALKTEPKRIVLKGVDEWTENGVAKGTRCQIKMLPAPLVSADKRNVKTLMNEVSKLELEKHKYPLNRCKAVKLDEETMATPTALQSSPPAPAAFQAGSAANAPVDQPMSPEEMLAMGGELVITVAQLSHLPKMDMMGKCDPLVKLELAGQTQKTTPKKKVYDTSWPDEPLKFIIPPKSGASILGKDTTLKITCFDADKFTEKDVVGFCELDILPLIASGQLKSPLLDEKKSVPRIGKDKEQTVIGLTSLWKCNAKPITRDIIIPTGPTDAEIAAKKAEEERLRREAAARAKAKADQDAEIEQLRLLEIERLRQLELERLRLEAEATGRERSRQLELERLRLEAEERERLRLLALAAVVDDVEGSGQWINMRIEIAKSVTDLHTSVVGIEKFRLDVITDVAETADLDTRDVYFQEIDISTADSSKSIVVVLCVDAGTTEGAKRVVRKCTSSGAPSDALKGPGRKITSTAVGIKSVLHYARPPHANASKMPTRPDPATSPGSAAYMTSTRIAQGTDSLSSATSMPLSSKSPSWPIVLPSSGEPGVPMKLSLGLGTSIYNMGDTAVFKENIRSKVAEDAKVDKSKVQVVGVEPDGTGMKCHLIVTGSQVSSSEIMARWQLKAK